MRGPAERQAKMLMGVTTEDFIPASHPIRRVRKLVDEVLVALSPQLTAMYAADGRYSVPPEHLIKASLLMGFYSIRSERQFCERLQYDLLFKWFLGLNITDNAFDHSTFSKNRKRLMEHDLAEALLGEVVREARRRRLISDDHFSVDGSCCRPGPPRRACAHATARTRQRAAGAKTRRWTSTESSGGTRRMSQGPTPKRSSRARAGARRRASPMLDTSSWRTAVGSSSTSWSPRQPGQRSAMPPS